MKTVGKSEINNPLSSIVNPFAGEVARKWRVASIGLSFSSQSPDRRNARSACSGTVHPRSAIRMAAGNSGPCLVNGGGLTIVDC